MTTLIYNPPVIHKPEFRLYYDDITGDVICYSCQHIDNLSYIVVDALIFAEARPDMCVIDGKLHKKNQIGVIQKLVPASHGVLCAKDDISVIVNDHGQLWGLRTYQTPL